MTETDLVTNAHRNFILQQGLDAPEHGSCSRVSGALSFQPGLVGLILLVGVISQSAALFAVLAALLWWCALVPRLNPFDLVHNRTLRLRPGVPALGPAPMPRRFAQGMAGAFAAAIAACIGGGLPAAAWGLEALFLVAVAAQVFARFCLGSFVYHLLSGRAAFAMRTLPWRRGA